MIDVIKDRRARAAWCAAGLLVVLLGCTQRKEPTPAATPTPEAPETAETPGTSGTPGTPAPEPGGRDVWGEARQRGIEFRAVGNEPGWSLEIDRGAMMDFIGDYGETRAKTTAPEPVVDRATGRTTYHAKTEAVDLKVEIETKPCSDGMSDTTYDHAVTVIFNGKTYTGCGRSLE